MGDPAGIGAEVIVKSLADATLRASYRISIHGAQSPMASAAATSGSTPFWNRCSPDAPPTPDPGQVILVDDEFDGTQPEYHPDSALGGEHSFHWVMRAIEDLKAGAHACVTAPISKRAWHLAGHGQYPGHTELFASQWKSDRFAMFFHAPPTPQGPGLNVILTTVHIPLSQVVTQLTTPRIVQSIELAHETMCHLGIDQPRIGVCGVNPHAGEGGLLGTEDDAVIRPAVDSCARRGMLVTGPHPADTIFQRALSSPGCRPRFDVVVAMYHDQGLAPLKTLAWDRAVNTTVGLPIVRTSPDHGTGFDIAGRGIAHPGSMRAAIELAATLAARRHINTQSF